ncbi:Ig-like domain-containing protein [Ructibacterium gallinarum]|uniref:Uncharacterized protein n=1 Tax=Ructibacterium gallinarum TaxID=2779355 RepID=A0A9D5M4U9_9FIRM|nr:Ig-like domain-containing protein [Ructibacterium gallinarum]MBE5039574.1 hypothetical protein [Ructibacterium gallinarum]
MKKQMIAIFMIAAIVLTVPVFSAGIAQNRGNGLVAYYGFDNDYEVSGAYAKIVEDEQKGRVMYFDGDGTKESYAQQTFSINTPIETDCITIGFDVCAGQTNQWTFTQFIKTVDNHDIAFAAFYFTADGKFGYMKEPAWSTPKSEVDGTLTSNYVYTDYEANQWFHIDIIFDMSTGRAAWYKDGQKWGEGSSFSRREIMFDTMHITMRGGEGYNDSPTGDEYLKFDNIACFNTSKNAIEATCGYTDLENKTVRAVFSESMTSIDAEILNTETGDTVAMDSIVQHDAVAEITYVGDLAPNTQYAVKIKKDSTGAASGEMAEDILLYFRTAGDAQTPSQVFYYDCNSSDTTPAFEETEYQYRKDVGEEHGTVISFAAKTTAGTDISEVPLPFEEYDYTALSFDFMIPNANRTGYIYFMGDANNNPISFVFNKNGYLLGGSGWIGAGGGADYDAIKDLPTFMGAYEIGEWISFKIEYDKAKDIFSYYLNGEKIKEDVAIAGYNGFRSMTVVQNNKLAETLIGNEAIYIDNILYEKYVSVPYVETVEFSAVNGAVYGPLAEINAVVYKIDVCFSGEINPETLTDETIKLYCNGAEVVYEKGIYSADEMRYTIYPKEILIPGNMLYVSVNGVENFNGDTLAAYNTYIYQDEAAGGFAILELQYVDENGNPIIEKCEGPVYGSCVIANNTTETKTILVVSGEYIKKKLMGFHFTEKSLNPGEIFTVNAVNQLVTAENTPGSDLVLTVLNGAELHSPLTDKVTIEGSGSE